jgi:Mrp family chromosome partitioning ATPase
METIPLVEIDLEQDQPATAAGQGWQPKYDQLAMRIHDLTTTTKPLRVLVAAAAIHDASPRFTVNLAIALTRQRLRVLLIETDPNSTELAELFDVPNEIGFCQWQHGEIDDDDAIQPSSLAGLSIMPAGTPLQPPNVTSPSPAAAPWPELTDTFDVLILYAPAALAVSPPELPNLLTQAHACLALTRRRRDIAPLRQRLAAFRQITACHPLAVVSLNS